MATSTQTATAKKSNTTKPTGADTPFTDSMSEALHQSVDALSSQAAKTEEKLRKTAATSADVLAEKHQQAQSYWDKSAAGRFTRENPLATAGIAFAAGMLVTSLLKRK